MIWLDGADILHRSFNCSTIDIFDFAANAMRGSSRLCGYAFDSGAFRECVHAIMYVVG